MQDQQLEQIILKSQDDLAYTDKKEFLFQHAILCQVYLPYRDPGDNVTEWVRQQGKAFFGIQCTKVLNPETGQLDLTLGLPFGPKARLILTHINTLALKQKTALIQIPRTFSSFITAMGLSRNGYQIDAIKNQMARLAASMVTIAFTHSEPNSGTRAAQVDSKIINGFDLWFPKDQNQRVLWGSTIKLSDDYFNSLMEHAVPLDKEHLAKLSNNSMALDIYSWLAQRLHRISKERREFIHWQGLKEQFGESIIRLDHFKTHFRKNLKMVLGQYQNARIEEDLNKGFYLYQSQPPVAPKLIATS